MAEVMKCPMCHAEAERDEVDTGIGIDAGPWRCSECPWEQSDTPETFMMKGIVDEAVQGDGHSIEVNRADLYKLGKAIVAKLMAKKYHLNARFHIEGGKLVKTSNGQPVPPEEPTFILRGRDLLAMPTLATYYKLGEQDGCNEEFLAGIREAMNGFARFEFEQRAKMKQPGITRGL